MPLGVCNTCRRGFILEIQPESEAPDCPGCGELLEMQRVGKFQDLPRVPLALLRMVTTMSLSDCRESAAVA